MGRETIYMCFFLRYACMHIQMDSYGMNSSKYNDKKICFIDLRA